MIEENAKAYDGRGQRALGAGQAPRVAPLADNPPTALIAMLKQLGEFNARLQSVNERLAGVVDRAIGPQTAEAGVQGRDEPKQSGIVFDVNSQLERLGDGLRAVHSYLDHIERLV